MAIGAVEPDRHESISAISQLPLSFNLAARYSDGVVGRRAAPA
jgi:hypothetical protein